MTKTNKRKHTCPICGDALTDRTEIDGRPTYCDTCDREVLDYVSTSGESIQFDDYERWIRQGAEQFSVLDENFNSGDGADNEDDAFCQFYDAIAMLLHYGHARRFDVAEGLRLAQLHFEAERHPDPPKLESRQ